MISTHDTDLRDSNYTSYVLPPQAIPTKDKTPEWGKDCMDSLENIGIRELNRVRPIFDRAYKITEGNFDYSDMADSTLFLQEVDYWREQADLRDNIEHYGFIEPLVNQLIGEFLKKPDPVVVDAIDPISSNDYTRTKTDMLWHTVNSQLEEEIGKKMISMGLDPYKEDFNSPEEQQQYQQQLQQTKQQLTPKEIEQYMNQNWKAVYVEWAEETLKDDRNRFDIDELDRDNLYDYLVTGRCFRHYRIGYDYYRPEVWSPKETFTAATSKTRYVQKSDYAGRIRYMTPNEIIKNYGHILSEEQKVKITSSQYSGRFNDTGFVRRGRGAVGMKDMIEKGGGELTSVPFKSYYPYSNAKYLQDITGIDLGLSDMFPNGNQYGSMYERDEEDGFRVDLSRVVECYWVGLQKIGYLTTIDPETGMLITENVTDQILPAFLKHYEIKKLKNVTLEQHEKNPVANTIVWDYQPITYYGVKICKSDNQLSEDLYLGMKPTVLQLEGDSQTYENLIPVSGIVEESSFVGKIYQYQIDHNIAMNMARDYMSKELGVFYLMDFSYLPSWLKDAGGTESLSKLYDIIRELGFMPIDGETQNTRSSFNQFSAVNMDLTQAMLAKVEYARVMKQLAFETVGMTAARMGNPNVQESATGVQQSVFASYAQTEVLYDKFAKFQKSDAEILINVAQLAKNKGIDRTVSYVDSDKHRTFLKMNDPNLQLRRFRLIPQNNSKRRSELEVIKQVYMNDNTIQKDLESIANVVSSDSVSKVIQLGRIGRQIAELEQEKQRVHQQKMQEQALQAQAMEQERARQFEEKEAQLDRELQLRKQAILALGFTKEDDARAGVINELRYSLDKLKVETETQNLQAKTENERLKDEREHYIDQQKLRVEESKIDVEKYKADKTLEVARENRNQYSPPRNKKQD